jgi:hypothetical protein
MDLTFFDRARNALAKAVDLDEVKEIRDKAEALRVYAKQAKDATGMERACTVIRLRAERRMGELLTKTVKPGNPQLSPGITISLGKLGITGNQSAKWQRAATLPLAEFEEYISAAREPTTAGVLRLVLEQERQEPGPRSGGNILSGPASRLWDRLDDDSVDLFLTDPPYSEIDCYEELSKLAAAKLKPGCLCLAYCGIGYLPAVLEAMAGHLTYHWLIAVEFSGRSAFVYSAKVKNAWQPIVAFGKGKSKAGWFTDHRRGNGREKEAHAFQKTVRDIEYLIHKLTPQNAIVVDPYCGSGSVPLACKNQGRSWLACEIDSQTAATARRRVA